MSGIWTRFYPIRAGGSRKAGGAALTLPPALRRPARRRAPASPRAPHARCRRRAATSPTRTAVPAGSRNATGQIPDSRDWTAARVCAARATRLPGWRSRWGKREHSCPKECKESPLLLIAQRHSVDAALPSRTARSLSAACRHLPHAHRCPGRRRASARPRAGTFPRGSRNASGQIPESRDWIAARICTRRVTRLPGWRSGWGKRSFLVRQGRRRRALARPRAGILTPAIPRRPLAPQSSSPDFLSRQSARAAPSMAAMRPSGEAARSANVRCATAALSRASRRW